MKKILLAVGLFFVTSVSAESSFPASLRLKEAEAIVASLTNENISAQAKFDSLQELKLALKELKAEIKEMEKEEGCGEKVVAKKGSKRWFLIKWATITCAALGLVYAGAHYHEKIDGINGWCKNICEKFKTMPNLSENLKEAAKEHSTGSSNKGASGGTAAAWGQNHS